MMTMRAAFRGAALAFLATLVTITAGVSTAHAQAVPTGVTARPVQGDPGISSMSVLDDPSFRVLRDYAEPGATRRMHNHPDATYHVFTLVTGTLRVTVEGEQPKEVHAGEVVNIKGGANHTFTNVGTVIATIVEVFGKAPAAK